MRYIIFLMMVVVSCRAQLPSYVSAGAPVEGDAMSYVEWYNATVIAPNYDTVSVFKMPEHSDLRYVIIRANSTARVEYTNGRFIGFLTPDRLWIERVKFSKDGVVVGGMNPIMISGAELIVQYERCIGCKWNGDYRGDL